ncbi:hypothetical protein [Gordonia oryzae]|uniref:hypothetical protein n=1 Tax=Gordonia oryzae TaxID=2487349 RepID=UPI001FE3ABF5|nr:hypothetical protein [Gordonia oryzae]
MALTVLTDPDVATAGSAITDFPDGTPASTMMVCPPPRAVAAARRAHFTGQPLI